MGDAMVLALIPAAIAVNLLLIGAIRAFASWYDSGPQWRGVCRNCGWHGEAWRGSLFFLRVDECPGCGAHKESFTTGRSSRNWEVKRMRCRKGVWADATTEPEETGENDG